MEKGPIDLTIVINGRRNLFHAFVLGAFWFAALYNVSDDSMTPIQCLVTYISGAPADWLNGA